MIMEALSFLFYPFLACVVLIVIHAYFGVHILERGIIFVDIALAQFIGIGIALSFFLSYENTYVLSVIFAILGASMLSLSRKLEHLVNIEAFIGVLYIFSFAVSILILDRSPHGAEEFKAILNGNILWLTPKDILSAVILYGIIGSFHFVFRKKFLALTFEGRNGFLLGISLLCHLCAGPCEIRPDGRNTSGLFISDYPCPYRKALHERAFQDFDYRLGCRTCGKRYRHRHILQTGLADSSNDSGIAKSCFSYSACCEVISKKSGKD